MRFSLFLLNGAILGILTAGLQKILNGHIQNFSAHHEAISSALAITPFIFINFILQKTIIFRTKGCIYRFIISNGIVMILVSVTVEIYQNIGIINFNGLQYNPSFVLAALSVAPISYLMKKYFVFKVL